MSDAPFSPAEARHELLEVAASVRALVDWYEMTGVTGVPRGAIESEPVAAPMRASMVAPQPPQAPPRYAANSFENQASPTAPVRPPASASSFEPQRASVP